VLLVFANIAHDGAVSSATNEKQNVMYLNTLLGLRVATSHFCQPHAPSTGPRVTSHRGDGTSSQSFVKPSCFASHLFDHYPFFCLMPPQPDRRVSQATRARLPIFVQTWLRLHTASRASVEPLALTRFHQNHLYISAATRPAREARTAVREIHSFGGNLCHHLFIRSNKCFSPPSTLH